MNFVLDASLALKWAFEDEATPAADAVLLRLRDGEAAAVAPNWHQEVLEGLLSGLRRSRIAEADASAFLGMLDTLEIAAVALHPLAGSSTWLLAREHRLSAYDAGCLALCVRFGLPLAADDGPLRKAAQSRHLRLLC